MTNMDTNCKFRNIRQVIWPIESHELKKFLPMALMMFCILFNYSTLRSMKDTLVVTSIGPEVISFLKSYLVLPSAIAMMIIYAKLCNIMNSAKVFYTVTSFFLLYLALFTLVLYPNLSLVQPDPELINRLSSSYPNFQWFIKIIGQWCYASFYIISELWGSMMLSLLFWQFANQVTKTEEAKRFYSTFGLIGNFSLIVSGYAIDCFLSNTHTLFCICIFTGIVTMLIYTYINAYVLTDPKLHDPSLKKATKSKTKLSIAESFKMIISSKYIGLIVVLVLAYGISINLVEGVWKSKARELYPTVETYGRFMANYQKWQGIVAIIFMIIGSNILRKVSWRTAAIFTPAMIFTTGLAFFGFIFLDNIIPFHLGTLTPLAIAVIVGTIQNILSKATKYSLFDSTKEMTYIPIDNELKTKGKAAVDVIGGRLGKSGGALIQSTFFILLPNFTFVEASPYFAAIFFVIVVLWIMAVTALSKEYQKALQQSKSTCNN